MYAAACQQWCTWSLIISRVQLEICLKQLEDTSEAVVAVTALQAFVGLCTSAVDDADADVWAGIAASDGQALPDYASAACA